MKPIYLGGANCVRLHWMNGTPGDGPVWLWVFVRDRNGGGSFFRTRPFH